jgi:hypothetical protein
MLVVSALAGFVDWARRGSFFCSLQNVCVHHCGQRQSANWHTYFAASTQLPINQTCAGVGFKMQQHQQTTKQTTNQPCDGVLIFAGDVCAQKQSQL